MTDKSVLAIGAHPDDVEFMGAGTLVLLRQKGWRIHIATMTPGDCGSAELKREEISRIRRGEAAASAALLEGEYHCAESEDAFVMYDKPTLLKVIRIVRQARPQIVLAPSPDDYMADHETASRLAWNACFAAGIPNIDTPGEKPWPHVPHLYYMDPLNSKDKFGVKVTPTCYVDIAAVAATKEKMLCCHASQRDWLKAHHGVDEYVAMLKTHDAARGREISAAYAEAFRQHLGHAFPQDNILKQELGPCVYVS
jgi:LmbE family N-acetylglucosaminyl deacetylase